MRSDSRELVMKAMGINPSTRGSDQKYENRKASFKKLFRKVGQKNAEEKLFTIIYSIAAATVGYITWDAIVLPYVWYYFGYITLPAMILVVYSLVWTVTREHPNRLLPLGYIGSAVFLVITPACALLVLLTRNMSVGGVIGRNATYDLLVSFGTTTFLNAFAVVLSLVMMTGLYVIYPMLTAMVGDTKRLYFKLSGKTKEEVEPIQPVQPATVTNTVVPLNLPTTKTRHTDEDDISGNYIVQVLDDFGMKGVQSVSSQSGPLLDEHVLRLPQGMKPSRLVQDQASISNNLGIENVVVNPVVVGMRRCVSIQVPKEEDEREMVSYDAVKSSPVFRSTLFAIPMIIGKNVKGEPVVIDLQKMKHILVAGTTGAGKSKLVEVMLLSMLQSVPPELLELVIVDPKQLEMTSFANVPHLRCPIITDPAQAQEMLCEVCDEMDERYATIAARAISTGKSIRNITAYNKSIDLPIEPRQPRVSRRSTRRVVDDTSAVINSSEAPSIMKHLVVNVDEFADLMMHPSSDKKLLEEYVVRIAQKGRAAGIHLILATQRPTVDVVTGLIKANMPCKIALKVGSAIDSRVILDTSGAERLLGNGDALILNEQYGSMPYRVHGAYIDDDEVVEELSAL